MTSLVAVPGLHYLGLTGATLLGGAVNSVAGGGGFLVFPTLLKLGVQPVQANATGTVALWPGQPMSAFAYRRELREHRSLVWPMLTTALIGGTAGAIVLLRHSQQSFLRLVPWLFLMGAVLFALSKPINEYLKRRAEQADSEHHTPLIVLLGLLLPVCFYIGYFGAGAGLLTMTVLSLRIGKLAEANALKTIITTVANGAAVVTFIAVRAVEWRFCWLAMIACAVGGYVGARNARRVDDRILRPLIVLWGLGVSAYFFWKRAHGG